MVQTGTNWRNVLAGLGMPFPGITNFLMLFFIHFWGSSSGGLRNLRAPFTGLFAQRLGPALMPGC
jgi:hypothetical protein